MKTLCVIPARYASTRLPGKPLALIGIPAAQRSLENSVEVGERLQRARSLLREHGNYDWLTEHGGLVVLNNGIEFSAIYFIMLLALFFIGGGNDFGINFEPSVPARHCPECNA
jgi:hypothetical protein